jgi:hypothetical protein
MVSVFRDDRVENLAADNAPPPPKGEPGPVIFLVDHPSLTTMTLHDDFLGKGSGRRGKLESPFARGKYREAPFLYPVNNNKYANRKTYFSKNFQRGTWISW